MSLVPKDLTPVYKETIGKGAGARRWQRPVYVDRLPPCNHACPAGENIQAWLALAQAGDYEGAWRKYMEENPLPATHGRACYHPCESACNRQFLDQPVSIHSLDRFLGDLANDKGWTIAPGPPTGKRVLVVGAGPAGLSCAYHLRRFGHDVEIRDANAEPGGMMHYGIPAYRLPREGLDKEIARIEAMGVTITRNARVNDVLAEKAAGSFDAVFLAIGAQVANHIDIPAMDGGKIIDAVTLMERVEKGRAPALGRVVGIVGGGNTAMDAARIAKRLGAEEAVIIFRFDKAQMEAHPYEAMEAFAEGVKVKWLSTVKQFGEDEIVVEQMEMSPDGTGCVGTGQFQTLKTDSLVLAVGQHADVEFLKKIPDLRIGRGNLVEVDAQHAREPRHLRRRRHDRRLADDDGGGRPRQEGGAEHRRVAAWCRLREAAAASGSAVRAAEPHPVPRRRSSRACRAAGLEAHRLRRDRVRPLGKGSAIRGDAVPLLRQLLRVRQLLRRVPRAGDRQAGEGPVLSGRAGPLHRVRHVLRAVPVSCHRHDARAWSRGTGRAQCSRASARSLHRPPVASRVSRTCWRDVPFARH